MRAMVLALVLVGCGDDGVALAIDAGTDAAGGCAVGAPWASAPPVPGPIQETAAVALDGKVYVLGGFNGVLGVVAQVQIFDPATCTWSRGPDLPRAVHHANAAVVDGTIYVVGAMTGLDFRAIGEVWAWRPGDATWRSGRAMPAGSERGSSVVGVIGDQIYVAGGLRGGAVAEVSRYRPSSDTWEALEPLPAPRDHACGGVVAGRLYVAGGRRGAITSIVADLTAYEPGAGWSARAPMPTARGGTACGVIDDQVIVVGGEGNAAASSGVFAQVEVYRVVDDGWRSLAPMPDPRHGMAAAVVDGRLYMPGGAITDGFDASALHDVLTP